MSYISRSIKQVLGTKKTIFPNLIILLGFTVILLLRDLILINQFGLTKSLSIAITTIIAVPFAYKVHMRFRN